MGLLISRKDMLRTLKVTEEAAEKATAAEKALHIGVHVLIVESAAGSEAARGDADCAGIIFEGAARCGAAGKDADCAGTIFASRVTVDDIFGQPTKVWIPTSKAALYFLLYMLLYMYSATVSVHIELGHVKEYRLSEFPDVTGRGAGRAYSARA